MSNYCAYEKVYSGTIYEPPERECLLDQDYDCEYCPYRYSMDDYEGDKIDMEYDDIENSY